MLSIFSIAISANIEVVGKKRKKIDVNEFREELPYYEDLVIIEEDESEVEEDTDSTSNINYINWGVELADTDKDFNPFKLDFCIFSSFLFKGNNIRWGFKGKRDKIESGYKSNSLIDDMIYGYMLSEDLSAELSYSERDKELMGLDTRKKSIFDLSLSNKIKDPVEVGVDLSIERRVESSNFVEKEFSLVSVDFSVRSNFVANLISKADSEFSMNLSYFGDIFGRNGAGSHTGIVRLDTVNSNVLKFEREISLDIDAELEYNFISGAGLGVGAVAETAMFGDEGNEFILKAGLRYDYLTNRMKDSLNLIEDFDILPPSDLAKEYGPKLFLGTVFNLKETFFINFDASASYMYNKICYEEDPSIESRPIQLINYGESKFFVDANVGATAKFGKFIFDLETSLTSNQSYLAFTPFYTLKGRAEINNKGFFLAGTMNMKGSYYTISGQKGDKIEGYYTLDAESGFSSNNGFKLTVGIYNILDKKANYKRDFFIDKRKISVDLTINF
tara:strand:+ start:12849 stop:14357 length:1509 start_codon:yes stop_codon:yes gene_type:complete